MSINEMAVDVFWMKGVFCIGKNEEKWVVCGTGLPN